MDGGSVSAVVLLNPRRRRRSRPRAVARLDHGAPGTGQGVCGGGPTAAVALGLRERRRGGRACSRPVLLGAPRDGVWAWAAVRARRGGHRGDDRPLDQVYRCAISPFCDGGWRRASLSVRHFVMFLASAPSPSPNLHRIARRIAKDTLFATYTHVRGPMA